MDGLRWFVTGYFTSNGSDESAIWLQLGLTALNIVQTIALTYIAARWRKDNNHQ